MRKAKTYVMAAMCVLVLALGARATLAYLTDSESVTNTFTVGNVDIDLVETKSDFKMVPGQEIEKDPVVSVSAQSEDCWLFVKITEENGLASYIDYAPAAGWTALDGHDGVYYRTVLATDADRAFSVLDGDKVTVKEGVTKTMMEALIAKDGAGNLKVENGAYVLVDELPELTFAAYAIQKAGFDTAAAAWTQLNA